MDLWDDIESIERMIDSEEKLYQEQALINVQKAKNGFSVEREYMNSKAYHDKFERLPVNKDVQESIYKQVGRLMNEVDGQSEERMVAINGRTGEFLVDNFNRKGSTDKTGFTTEEYEKVIQCPDSVILINNHSYNVVPSGADLYMYNREKKVKLSIIACHDGDVYAIYKTTKIFEDSYMRLLHDCISRYGEKDGKKMITAILYKANKNDCLFTVKKL